MRLNVLGSGSKGNVTYLEINGTKILIDCGLSFRQINNRLSSNSLDLEQLDGILITHEHSDHIAGLNVLLKKVDTKVYITEETFGSFYWKYSENINKEKLEFITPYKEFMINDVSILPISVSHDASDAVGYIIKSNDKKVVYITDVGYLPQKDHEILMNADAYVFESNYDVTLLFTSNRPFYLKQRIDSVKGHLSNTDSAYNLAQMVGPNTKHIILAHPSRECNTKELAMNTITEIFNEYGINQELLTIEVATQDVPTKVYEF